MHTLQNLFVLQTLRTRRTIKFLVQRTKMFAAFCANQFRFAIIFSLAQVASSPYSACFFVSCLIYNTENV